MISNDPHDMTFTLIDKNTSRFTNDEKTIEVLHFMKETFPRFSLKLFLTSIFLSDNRLIKSYANIYLKNGGRVQLMEMLIGRDFLKEEVSDWIIGKSTKEFSQLTDRAARGSNNADMRISLVGSGGCVKLFHDVSELIHCSAKYVPLSVYECWPTHSSF